MQVAEILVRLQVRVCLRHRQQTLESLGELILSCLELRKRIRIVEHVGRDLDGAHLGARLGDAYEHLLLLLGESLDRIDQIRHQVRAPLVLVHNLGPGRLDVLVLALKVVVAATREGQDRQGDQTDGPARAHIDSPVADPPAGITQARDCHTGM